MIHRFKTYRKRGYSEERASQMLDREFFAAVGSNARKVVRVREGGRTVEVRVAK